MLDERVISSLKHHWQDLLKGGQELTYKKGQVLFYEGHTPYGLFVIREGKVRLVREGDRHSQSCPHEHLWHSPHGDVLGLTPFFDGNAYCCTCTAILDCAVVFVSKTQLLPFITAKKT